MGFQAVTEEKKLNRKGRRAEASRARSKEKIEFDDLAGKRQIKQILILLLKKPAKVTNFNGCYVKIDGKTFYRRHFYFAKQLQKALRKQRRSEDFRNIIGLETKKVSMLELVNTLFLGI